MLHPNRYCRSGDSWLQILGGKISISTLTTPQLLLVTPIVCHGLVPQIAVHARWLLTFCYTSLHESANFSHLKDACYQPYCLKMKARKWWKHSTLRLQKLITCLSVAMSVLTSKLPSCVIGSITPYRTHSTLCPPPLCQLDLATSMGGGAYNWITVISLVYSYAPFSRCGVCKGNSNGRIVRHWLAQLAMKLVVAQFCRPKNHEIINEGAECERSENAMQFLHHHQLAMSLPPHSQSLFRCIAGQ